jgi:YfiH family protein
LVTSVKGIGLAVQSADCLPILISSELVVAAVHAGRKGVTNGLISATVSKMRELGGENFEALIGPAICGKCYELEEVMYNDIVSKFPAGATSQDKHAIDIAKMATFELEAAGVNATHHGFCTKENLDFYSYRRDNASGRQVGIITL